MDRRGFLSSAFGISIFGQARAKVAATPVAALKCLDMLSEAERLGAQAMAAFHRPWCWKGLTATIEQTSIVTARAWLTWRGLDIPGYPPHCLSQASRRDDDITGIPWNIARIALLELKNLRVDDTPYPDGWYREKWRIGLHGMQRRALIAAIRACERCGAAVRSEVTTGRAAYRPARSMPRAAHGS